MKKLLLLITSSLLAFVACSQTVSNPNKDESTSKKESSTNEEPNSADEEGSVVAPTLKDPIVENDGTEEAKSYFDGLEKKEFLSQYKLHGTDSQKEEQQKEMNDSLKKGELLFDRAAQNTKWFVPATIQKGNLYFAMANSVKNQEISATNKPDSVAKDVHIAFEIISYYEQARSIFQQGINTIRSEKITDQNTQILEEYYSNTYYENCKIYRDLSDIYLNSPLPDSAAVAKEYIRYEGTTKEDAMEMTHEDLEAYREELSSKSREMKGNAISSCTSGILEAQKNDLKNEQVEATRKLLRVLDPNNSALQ